MCIFMINSLRLCIFAGPPVFLSSHFAQLFGVGVGVCVLLSDYVQVCLSVIFTPEIAGLTETGECETERQLQQHRGR